MQRRAHLGRIEPQPSYARGVRRAAPDFARLWQQTPRLTLRPLRHDDLDRLSALLGDADALVNWGPPLDRAGARDWILRNLARYETDGFGRCAVELRSTGELIGDCGLIRTTVEGTDEVELGWIVRRAHWGHGFATEAAAAWRDVAFAALGLKRIVSMVAEDNIASRRVAEKLGMTVERRVVWDDAPMLMYALSDPRAALRQTASSHLS
jgi:RimJ/RimL family protein N-acetyltransferase